MPGTPSVLAPAGSQFVDGRTVTVTAPASSANLGPGFDSVGMGLGVWDTASASLQGDSLVIRHEGLGADGVPLDENHLVYRSMLTAWAALGLTPPAGLELDYVGAVPHARGMGSSATAIVIGVGLATALAGHDLGEDAVRAFVNDVASGIEGHPDNASASVYGNATVSWAEDDGTWRTCVLTPHASLVPVVLVPETRLDTAVARAAMPTEVPLGVAASNSGRAALLAHALTTRPDLLMAATRDYLHQEPRRNAYPASMELVDRLRADGIPATISGAGPTVLAFATVETASRVEEVGVGLEVIFPGIPGEGLHEVSNS